jgi:hypothetical protein
VTSKKQVSFPGDFELQIRFCLYWKKENLGFELVKSLFFFGLSFVIADSLAFHPNLGSLISNEAILEWGSQDSKRQNLGFEQVKSAYFFGSTFVTADCLAFHPNVGDLPSNEATLEWGSPDSNRQRQKNIGLVCGVKGALVVWTIFRTAETNLDCRT